MSSTLDLNHWRRAEAIFEAALDCQAAERAALLDRACGADTALRASVETLLQHDDRGGADLPTEPPEGWTDSPSPGEHPWCGRVLGGYRLVRPIGAGGMSQVFLAEPMSAEDGRPVAVKILREEAQRGAELRSIRQERQILTRLDHPNIARALGGGTTEEGLPYNVLEYLAAETVTAFCDASRLSVDQRLSLFRKICVAVDFAHRHLVIHRDLKPSNILVTADGEPKLLDFGIAKLLTKTNGVEPTVTAAAFLTPGYAGPEQLAGRPASMATDIYALGVILHELLTGLRPVRRSGDDRGGLGYERFRLPSRVAKGVETDSHSVAGEAVDRAFDRGARPARLAASLRGDLDTIILHCLHEDPDRRYRSAAALEDDLRRYQAGFPVAARPPDRWYRLTKFVRRHRLSVVAGSVALALLLVAGIGLFEQNRQLIRQRDVAQVAQSEAEDVTEFLTAAFLLADPHQRRPPQLDVTGEVTALQILDDAARRLRSELHHRPRLRARLMQTIGTIYSRLSRDEDAEDMQLRALAIRRRLSPPAPAEIASGLSDLIFLYVDGGRLEAAAGFVGEALELLEQPAIGGEMQAELLSSTAFYAYRRGDIETAESRMRRALQVLMSESDIEPRRLQAGRVDLAGILTRRGRHAEAEELLRSVLAEISDDSGRELQAASVALDLGRLLTNREEFSEAEQLYFGALQTFRTRLGEEHRSTLHAWGALGTFYRETGRFAEAESVFEELLARRRKFLPGDILKEISVLKSLGLVALDRGCSQRAEGLFRQALELDAHHLGGVSAERPALLRNLGIARLEQQHSVEAEQLIRQAVDLMVTWEGPGPRYAFGLTSLAVVLVQQERFDEALVEARRAKQVLDVFLPAGHMRMSRALRAEGLALLGLDRFGEAESALLRSLKMSEGLPPRLGMSVRFSLCGLYRRWDKPAQMEIYCDRELLPPTCEPEDQEESMPSTGP